MPYQQSNGNEIAQSGEQRGCPAMCVRWNTVLKENGQIENTPIVKSPLVPGDTITQCPKQCDPKCCNSASQSFAQSDHSQSSDEELQDDQNHPPACMDGCPKACYPACRPGCCDAPRMTSMYQQSMAQQTPMMQPMQQPYVQQPIEQRETIPYPAFSSYPPQEVNEPIQARDIIPYSGPQRTPATFRQYSYTQPEMISQTRATIPQPFHVHMGQSIQQRSNVPKTKASIHAATCPIPCSPVCAPHCTKHCCESYD